MLFGNLLRGFWKRITPTSVSGETYENNSVERDRSQVTCPKLTSQSSTEQAPPLDPIPPKSELTADQLAAGVRVKRMMDDYSKVLNGTEIPGKSRAELYPYLIECRAGYDQICEFIQQNDFINWENRKEINRLLDDLELICQPLYKRQHHDSTLVAVVDTETTGLGAADEPISVAVILLDVSGKKGDSIVELDSYYGLREPTVPIHPAAQKVHGIDMETLRGQSLEMRSLRKIVDSADLLVAHNAKFDRRMLSKIVPEVMQAEWAPRVRQLNA